jgi:pimeloyl-ACP methyl ester carboxylesterase
MKAFVLACSLALSGCLAAATPAQGKLPRKPWFGAQMIPVEGGLRIGNLAPDGSAGLAGVKSGDVVKSIDGVAVTSGQQVVQMVGSKAAGTKLKTKVLRDGKEMDLEVTLATRPVDKGDNYTVEYDEVVSNGNLIRVLISKPMKETGKRPVLYLIQGIGYGSMEFPLSGPNAHAQLLKAYNDKGYVTVRVEKPGVGDSEGGPATSVDWEQELDAFRQALKLVKSKDYVDASKVFLFGHSMGGCHAPILASEDPVKGIAVYGTIVRSWQEYTIENTRRQALLGGMPAPEVDTAIRNLMAAQNLVITEGLDPAEAKTKHPEQAQAIDEFSPDGRTMSGMPLPYWRQVYKRNLADYWTKSNAHVFAIYGESDFLCAPYDHELIANIVNGVKPGTAKWTILKENDHLFNRYASQRESMQNWPQGQFNPAIIQTMLDWSEGVLAGK